MNVLAVKPAADVNPEPPSMPAGSAGQCALLVSGSSLGIATFVGMFVITWMSGRIAKMNAAAVFIALLFWAWLWGVWGVCCSPFPSSAL